MHDIKPAATSVCLCLMLGLGLTGLPAQAADKPSFLADGVLSVCMDPTFPPMEFFKAEGDSAPSGIDPDIAAALAEAWGVSLSVITMDFNGLLPSLGAERCDAVISGATLTEERQQTYDGIPYINTYVVIIGKAGDPPISGFDDLAGKAIAVQQGTTYVDRLEEENEALKASGKEPMVIQQYPKQSDAVQQLLIGRAFGVVTQDTEIAYRELQDPGKFSVVYTVPQKEFRPYGIYIRKNEADKAAFAAAIAELYASGAMSRIVTDWGLTTLQLEGLGYQF